MGCCHDSMSNDNLDLDITLDIKRRSEMQQADNDLDTRVIVSDFETDNRAPFFHQTSMKEMFIQSHSQRLSTNYNVGEIIGEGGFGAVRKATHKETGINVAVKSMLKTRISSDRISEFEILKKLDHPNIVQVKELYSDIRFYHIVQEFIQGQELFDYFQEQGPLNEAQVAEYIQQVLMALNYCHKLGLIHRDLKPENIMIKQLENGRQMPVIIDFGIAAITNFSNSIQAGTRIYQAPEDLQGNFSDKSDIWSMGVISYILLFGQHPFPNNDHILTFPKCQISYEAQEFIKKMLKVDASERINAETALNDPWFDLCKSKDARSNLIDSTAFSHMSSFNTVNKLKQAAAMYIATTYATQSQIDEIQTHFKSFDLNNDGLITLNEVQSFFQQQDVQEFDPIEVFRYCDMNQDGCIQYSEFVSTVLNWLNQVSQERLQASFKAFDVDGNGTIDIEDLKTLLANSPKCFDQLESIIRDADSNGDNVIDFEEFTRLLLETAN